MYSEQILIEYNNNNELSLELPLPFVLFPTWLELFKTREYECVKIRVIMN
jgi:hypothetical protein